MKKMFVVLGILALGVALGRFFDGAPPRAEAGGGQGGGVQQNCADINGDVNADGKLDVSDAVTILRYLFMKKSPTDLVGLCPRPLPETGQSKCYSLVGSPGDPCAGSGQWQEVPCAQAACKGQDGSQVTGCASEGRFTDNGDGTVTDNCTGLMWQKDMADVNGDRQIGDADRLAWCDALAYCEGLKFAGHDDWRLPNVRELLSIVDYGRVGPSIDPVFGPGLDWYWSSSSAAQNPDRAWYVFFGGYFSDFETKCSSGSVRAVRTGP